MVHAMKKNKTRLEVSVLQRVIKKSFTNKVTTAWRTEGKESHGIATESAFQAEGTECEKSLRQKYT